MTTKSPGDDDQNDWRTTVLNALDWAHNLTVSGYPANREEREAIREKLNDAREALHGATTDQDVAARLEEARADGRRAAIRMLARTIQSGATYDQLIAIADAESDGATSERSEVVNLSDVKVNRVAAQLLEAVRDLPPAEAIAELLRVSKEIDVDERRATIHVEGSGPDEDVAVPGDHVACDKAIDDNMDKLDAALGDVAALRAELDKSERTRLDMAVCYANEMDALREQLEAAGAECERFTSRCVAVDNVLTRAKVPLDDLDDPHYLARAVGGVCEQLAAARKRIAELRGLMSAAHSRLEMLATCVMDAALLDKMNSLLSRTEEPT